ncbi:MAG: M14 family zinc carboxypeptidase [Maricaulaceae bacterium]
MSRVAVAKGRGVFAAACSIVVATFTAGSASAQSFMPDVTFDPAIPTVEDVFGQPAGARITPAADVVAYFRALEAAVPDRIVVHPYAESWQGRELVYAVIGSPENIANLDAFAADMARLADPRALSAGEADALIARLPSSAWLAHSVHGDEISSSDAAMMTAYHLLAAEDDPVADAILENTIVFIDPVQNPDGRDRFVNGYYDTLGLEPAGDRIAAERNQPWPGGRFNHYLFDMNRDWFALTQPETRGKVEAFLDWMPLIYVDIHEMGSDSTYYFTPEAIPYNSEITEAQRAFLEVMGRNNARWFDRFGFAYFTREVYDALYPGYGSGWPLFQGALGTTYEQASARGLVADRYDGTELSYADGVRHHFTSSIATLETAATNRERLLRAFYDYRRTTVEEGRSGEVQSYIIPPQADQSGANRLAGLLAIQGVEVERAAAAFRACRTDYAAGSYVVRLDQPAGRLVRTLMEPDAPISEAFMAEQERRRANDLEVQLYDVTAWSLPLMFNLDVDRCNARPSGDFEPVPPSLDFPATIENPDAAYGFLAPWGSTASAQLLAAALREGIEVWSADLAFTHGGRAYPSGTLIFPGVDKPELAGQLEALAASTGAEIVGVDESWVTEGPNFGSENALVYAAPRVALAWDDPVSPTSGGATRYVIERQIGYPVTPVRTEDLGSPDLDAFDVLILPSGFGYGDVLGEGGLESIKDWMRRGGVLITTGAATRFAADPDTGLASLRRESAYVEEPAAEAEDGASVPGVILEDAAALDAAQTPAEESPDASPGMLARAETNPDHWLAAGLKPTLNVLVVGSDIYAPVPRDQGTSVVSFAGPEELVASGYLWEETRAQLAYKPFVVIEPMGRGYVVAFTQDPTVRGYLDGLNVLLANAIFRSAAHARR